MTFARIAGQAGDIAGSILEQFSVPGAALAIVSGDNTHVWGHGVCEAGGAEPVSATTTFQIASCSKAYTAAAAAILVDRGGLRWDDPVRHHLPEFQLHDERLSTIATVRDLLGMRLGYRNEGLVNWGRNPEHGVRFIFERMRYMEPISGFRETFTYFNPAYSLVAEIISRITGETFAAFLQRALIGPLGLTQTFVCEGRYLPASSHAFPHVLRPDGAVISLGAARCGGRIGESCVYSCAADSATWMNLYLDKGTASGKRLISEAAMAELHAPQAVGSPIPALDHSALAYCMGWQRRETPDGPILLHEGAEFGASTFTLLDPERHLGVSVYANLASAPAVKACAYSLLGLLAGRPPRDWPQLFAQLAQQDQATSQAAIDSACLPASDALDLDDLAGSYFHPANGVADITPNPGGLHIQLRDGWIYDCDLEGMGGGVFRATTRHPAIQGFSPGLQLKAKFTQSGQGLTLLLPGLGHFRRLNVPAL